MTFLAIRNFYMRCYILKSFSYSALSSALRKLEKCRLLTQCRSLLHELWHLEGNLCWACFLSPRYILQHNFHKRYISAAALPHGLLIYLRTSRTVVTWRGFFREGPRCHTCGGFPSFCQFYEVLGSYLDTSQAWSCQRYFELTASEIVYCDRLKWYFRLRFLQRNEVYYCFDGNYQTATRRAMAKIS